MARKAFTPTRGPLVHSPLSQPGVLQSMPMSTPDGPSSFTPPSSAMKTPPYAHSEYEALWREAEDRAAALSVELKFLKDKEKKAKQDVETQKRLLRKAAAEVKQEALEMREKLSEAKELELELELLKLDLNKTQKENAALSASLEGERAKLGELMQLEEKGESAHASSSEMYSEKVKSLEESLVELSGKLKELSSAELEEPYPPPQEMKSNHVWQQATNAAKARSRGQRAAAFAGQARAEARVSALQRELDSQLRRNIALEKGLQIAKVKSLTSEENEKNLMTMSQELEGISKKYHETEALCTDLKDATENFNAFITQTKELASSLLSDIEPIQADEDYADSIEISMESETEDSEASSSDKSQYTKAFSLLASAVRKAKAAMKYTKASHRAQLQAKEVALSEAHEERERYKEEKEKLTTIIAELRTSNEDLQSNVSELQDLLESSTNEKEGSMVDIERELQQSNETITDLVSSTKSLEEQKASLERKLFSVEKEKKNIQKELKMKQEKYERLRDEASSKDRAATVLLEQKAALSDELAEVKRDHAVRVSEAEKRNMDMAKELRFMGTHAESLQSELDNALQVHNKRVEAIESEIAEKKDQVEEWKDKAESLQMLTDELKGSIEDLKTRLEGSMLESAAKGLELESTKTDTSRLEAQLNAEIAKREDDLQKSHSLRLDLQKELEQGNRKLKSEIQYLKEIVSRRDAEQDEIVNLRDALHTEQEKSSKQEIDIEQLNAYISALKIEMEKYIEMLTSSNAEKRALGEKVEELEGQLSIRTAESERRNSQVYEEQLSLLKENLERKNEQIKLYGTACRDMLTGIKESFAFAFEEGILSEGSEKHLYEQSNDSEGQNFDFDMSTYVRLKNFSSEVFPLLKNMVEEDKETIKQMKEDTKSAKEDLEIALSREIDLQKELESAKSECNQCKEERDTFRNSVDLAEAHVAELKKVLEASAIQVTESETTLKSKTSELSHLHEELEGVQKQQRELHHIIDLFKEAEVQFFNLFLAMEHQLNRVGGTAATCLALLVDAKITKTPLTLMKEILGEIKVLEESCKQQKDIISAHTGRGGFKSFDESSHVEREITLLKEELLSSSRIIKRCNDSRSISKLSSHKRPWWQRALILPVRLLPAVALIGASSGKSNELRSAVKGLIKARSPSKVKKRQLLGGKPYTNSTGSISNVMEQQTHNGVAFGVPTTGTREVN